VLEERERPALEVEPEVGAGEGAGEEGGQEGTDPARAGQSGALSDVEEKGDGGRRGR
jgi:hypothetical protein